MGVSSSLYSSISGLSTMGEAMSVLGDNVANVNTVSFKSSRTTFQDVLAQSVSTAAGAAQVGRGVTLSTVSGLFAQGSFESSSSATDMAIGGQGFFMLRASDSAEADLYSRAGEFSFDQEGFIVNPVGHFAQGWTIDSATGERAGTIGDMRIDKTTPPVSTKEIEVITNLDSREVNEINEIRLFDAWNGTNAAAVNPTDAIDSAQFEYTTAIKTYDSKGASHDMTIYFDRTTEDNEWEFLVTSEPSEDKRVLDAREQLIYVPETTYNYDVHKGAGALLYGLIQFDTSGNIQAMEAFNVPPDGNVDPALDDNRINLATTDTYYSFEANFTGATTNDSIKLNMGALYSGVQSQLRQVLVSELGSTDSNVAGANYITSETAWGNVFDGNGLQLTGDGASGTSDQIVVAGFDNTGARVTSVYDVDTSGKVQGFLDTLNADFGANASIDAYGRLKITDLTAGPSGLNIVSLTVDGTIDGPATDDNANPFGETGVNGDTILNITTSKRKVISNGQLLNATGSAVTGANTSWISIYDNDTPGVPVADGDTFTFTGVKGDGTNIIGQVFTVDTTVSATNTGTVQELLDWVETNFDADAEIDGAGRLVLTDRLADSAATGGYNSQLAISTVVSSGANPFYADNRTVTAPGVGYSNAGLSTVMTGATAQDSVWDVDGVALSNGATLTFAGTNPDGTAIAALAPAVDTATPGTMQDILDTIEAYFDANGGDVTAMIDNNGQLVVTDLLAGSQLAITSVTASAGGNPFAELGVAAGFAGSPFASSTTTDYLVLDADVSGEDGSQQGVAVSLGFAPEALASTQYANSSTTIFQDQNGFASGFLQSVAVDTDGVITGAYSNGQVLKKAQVALANFSSLSGLFKSGGNLFRETTDSGAPVTGAPGTNGLGSIAPNALEQSNVDLGTEFVKLITVQRGFQANSKIITTVDEMMNDLINMKR